MLIVKKLINQVGFRGYYDIYYSIKDKTLKRGTPQCKSCF
jgi:hypothetical protein